MESNQLGGESGTHMFSRMQANQQLASSLVDEQISMACSLGRSAVQNAQFVADICLAAARNAQAQMEQLTRLLMSCASPYSEFQFAALGAPSRYVAEVGQEAARAAEPGSFAAMDQAAIRQAKSVQA